MISVIVPTHNEEESLEGSLSDLSGKLGERELIVADGGSDDRTAEIASRYARVVRSSRGRGTQLNVGADASSGEVLLFLHADCRLENGALEAIDEAMASGELAGGCLQQRIEARGWGYRLIEFMIRLRALRHSMYGDQGVFVRRSVFIQIGGFPDIPLMEDVVFSKRLRRAGRVLLVDKTISSSARRWRRLGISRTTLTNWYLRALFTCGVSPQRLAEMYYRNGNQP